MDTPSSGKSSALAMLHSERPRNVSWLQAAGLLFGDWGTSRLYVLGLAFLFAGHTSLWLVVMMSGLILAVGWAYSQICRIYPDGGGVYTAARNRSRTLAVIGALLLFADYTVTASLSVLDGFHYFGLPLAHQTQPETMAIDRPQQPAVSIADAGNRIISEHHIDEEESAGKLLAWDSPGLWSIIAIAAIGAFNLFGPKHSAGFAVFAALGMVFITLLITVAGLIGVPWHEVPQRMGSLHGQSLSHVWIAFVSIVLALSGVEAIANLTGVMKKPVFKTASKAIWVVAIEVAVFNILLAICMVAIFPLDRYAHRDDMLAVLSLKYVGRWGEVAVRVVGGLLLLSAGNTAVNGLMSIVYVVSRDDELPAVFQKVNRFGAPWVAAVLAAGVPIIILLISHDVGRLADLYAIGVIGAVAINVSLCTIHPRLRGLHRKIPMAALGLVLMAIWITLAFTKIHALIFVAIVMAVGLSGRALNRMLRKRRPKPSLLRQAILEQLTESALAKPRVVLATAGSDTLADAALDVARLQDSALVVCFIRQVSLNYKVEAETRLTLDTDIAAQQLIADFLAHGQRYGVPIIPMYDTGPNAAELIAETAAMNGASRVLIGSSRRGVVHKVIRGSFQRDLENLLPPEIVVQVISADAATEGVPQVSGV